MPKQICVLKEIMDCLATGINGDATIICRDCEYAERCHTICRDTVFDRGDTILII